jgi:hypothetical protein
MQDGDGNDLSRWPTNAKKPWPGQKILDDDQSLTDPSEDAPPWKPMPFAPVVPVIPVDPIPFPGFWAPVFVPG